MSSPPNSQPTRARLRDLQGLRAIAVLAVMAGHAGLGLSGGFIGVDVFFVLSGFIITLMLLREHATTGTISFRRFYIRRIKRLAPALAVTSIATVLLALLFLSPLGPQETTFKTALGATFGVANWVIAAGTGDYFGTAAERNAMLHTWSLAVEEQFYLVLPALMLFTLALGSKIGKRCGWLVPFSILGLLAIGSLASIRVGTVFPLGYYGPVTRAWEFLAGCLLALVIAHVRQLPRILYPLLGLVGLGLMLWGLIAITPETPFPGKWTLVPVVATLLLIVAGQGGPNIVSGVLSTKPMVAIGDWSYSLYLWHWPFIVVAKAIWPFSSMAPIAAAAVSVIPAHLSYRYVEEPFRHLQVRGVRQVSRVVAAILLPPTAAAMAAWLVFAQILTPAFGLDEASAKDPLTPAEATADAGLIPCRDPLMLQLANGLCGTTRTGAPTVLLAGDSHAEHLLPALTDAFPDLNLEIISVRSPKPFGSSAGAQAVVDYVARQPNIRAVVYSRNLGRDGRGLSEDEEAGMRLTVEGMSKLGRPVFVLDDNPLWPLDMFSCTHRFSLAVPGIVCEWDRDYFAPRESAIREDLNGVLRDIEGAKVVEVHGALCDANVCRRAQDGEPLYSDANHVTAVGAALMVSYALERHPDFQAALSHPS
ncbi:acyltransferase [Tessaracoccus sp. MC1627]|uniref:acyltransferase family protein n=1 Tax=Tessaracoccus sp. MC1627 TaxID=2760312 RepID=UPI0016035E99|nr:acyltransferase family protein [Tessaracoccus sp. MC1627]MBB1513203.1 acyltransferase [Tessaracoccus sp. MC1627]MBB1513464.1 acyltransferase [Tessaracoccus sp. MC1627]